MKTPSGPRSLADRTDSPERGKRFNGIETPFYSIVCLWVFVLSFFFFACASEPEPQIKLISDTQDRYAGLAPTVPALVLLPAASSSAVPKETLRAMEDSLRRQLVSGGRLKPYTMGKWLAASFGRQKAANTFAFLASLREERYGVPLSALGRINVFAVDGHYGLLLNVFPFTGSPCPVSVLRFFREGEEAAAISACLQELYARFFAARREGRKRVAVEGFRLEFRKLLELASGEFEFIAAPLVVQNGVTLREGDEFFSLLFGYCLAATDMVELMPLSELRDYAEAKADAAADYLVRGRVQLSEEMNVLSVEVFAAATGSRLFSLRHPFRESGLAAVWEACREAAFLVIENLFPSGAYGLAGPFNAEGRGFFCNSMLIGRDRLGRYLLPRGMHEIHTGSYLKQDEPPKKDARQNEPPAKGGKQDSSSRVFYVLLDTENRIFRDREGEYVWNLLKK